MISATPAIDPRAREISSFTQEGPLFQLTLSCGHVVSRRIMIGGVPRRAICPDCPAGASELTPAPSTIESAPASDLPRRGRRRARKAPSIWYNWTPERIARLRMLWADQSLTTAMIAEEMDARTANVIIGKAHALGLGKRRGGRKPRLTPNERFRHGGHHRRFVGAVGAQHRVRLSPAHAAAKESRTLFRNRVTPSSKSKHVLVSGENSRKIGRAVLKGPWKGMPIVTLTLQERATCPRSCEQWLNCFGNNMNWALRIQNDDDFPIHLSSELLRLQSKHPDGFVVRLHVLGDFYSTKYVEFWRMALEDLPALHVFGYTARPIASDIGAALHAIMLEHWDRFAMRWSNRGSDVAAAEVVETAGEANGIICPAERDENRSCGTCGLCWAAKAGAPAVPLITFIRH